MMSWNPSESETERTNVWAEPEPVTGETESITGEPARTGSPIMQIKVRVRIISFVPAVGNFKPLKWIQAELWSVFF